MTVCFVSCVMLVGFPFFPVPSIVTNSRLLIVLSSSKLMHIKYRLWSGRFHSPWNKTNSWPVHQIYFKSCYKPSSLCNSWLCKKTSDIHCFLPRIVHRRLDWEITYYRWSIIVADLIKQLSEEFLKRAFELTLTKNFF